jgi:hypothetical protein
MNMSTTSVLNTHRSGRASAAIAQLGAASFAVAAVWYTLATRGVTVSGPLQIAADPSPQKLATSYRWLGTTIPQERLYISVWRSAGFYAWR